MTTLRILCINNLEIEHLPLNVQKYSLSRIRQVTMTGLDEPRHYCIFDLRLLPALLKVTFFGPGGNSHARLLFVSTDPEVLKDNVMNDRDQEFIQDWSDTEMELYKLEEDFVRQHESEEVRMKLEEKNRRRYWFRDLIHNRGGTQRHFRVIKRLYRAIHIWSAKSAAEDELKVAESMGSLRVRNGMDMTTVYVDLDFDIDTRKILWRRVWSD